MIIGSGPIVIGQACEFDYSGTQACKVLRDEGYRVVLVNSNPATIMTDPEFADATYVEPLDVTTLTEIIERERPDALLPTLGGQTALNLAIELHDAGVLDTYGVELIGASVDAIRTAENRWEFKAAMEEIGLACPRSGIAHTLDDAMEVSEQVGYPLIVRPSFILGGGGTGIAYDADQMREVAAHGLATSPVTEILIEQSVVGWKEYELEVMRDHADNVVVVCSIENFDPMGVHTGDSITVAPAQTLTDVEYQRMRDAAFACIRRIGVDTGGSNIQFALNPADGEMVVIEMNPRVSRSSALASKATGFPIAKIAARLAVGYRLDEVTNDITGETPASFEPTIDYVVTKMPRWAFEKLPGASGVLGTMMQSVGEVMAIGRTFPESVQKALRSLETGRLGLNCRPGRGRVRRRSPTRSWCGVAARPTPDRLFAVEAALRRGLTVERLARGHRDRPVVPRRHPADLRDPGRARRHRRPGGARPASVAPGEARSASATPSSRTCGRATRRRSGRPGSPPGCASPTRPSTPARPSSRPARRTTTARTRTTTRSRRSTRPAVVILGSGPNRIGQGVEFDYCCVHAAFALSDAGYETVMVNCNPETVSTDYDTSDRLFFEPLTPEDVLNDLRGARRPGRARRRGRQPRRPDAAEAGARARGGGDPGARHQPGVDRPRRGPRAVQRAVRAARHPASPRAVPRRPPRRARAIADGIGYPVLVRPSYVLGGRAMQIVYDDDGLDAAMAELAGDGQPRARGRPLRGAPGARSTASSRTRSRSTSTRSATPPARWSSAG